MLLDLCPPLTPPKNGSISIFNVEGGPVRFVANYSCNTGYDLVPKSLIKRECWPYEKRVDNGILTLRNEWNGKDPECKGTAMFTHYFSIGYLFECFVVYIDFLSVQYI